MPHDTTNRSRPAARGAGRRLSGVSLLAGSLVVSALLAAPAGPLAPRPVRAQEGVSPEELGARIRSDVASLKNGEFARRSDAHALALAQKLLHLDDPRADAGLADILGDSSVPLSIVRQVIVAAVIEPEKRLLPAVLKRLLQDRDSTFDRSLDEVLRSHADAALVRRLAGLANDATRKESLRIEAARTLGRTGEPTALEPLVELWGSANSLMAKTAATAFHRVFPAGIAGRKEARDLLDDLRRRELTPWDYLTDLVRVSEPAEPTVPRGAVEREFVALALALVNSADLDQLLTHYVASEVGEVRRAGLSRLADFPFEERYEGTARADARRKAADAVLLRMKSMDDDAGTALAYAALLELAPGLDGWKPATESLRVVLDHTGGRTGLDADVRRSAIRLLGELRCKDAIEPLQVAYDRLGDADWTTRKSILDALDRIASHQLLGWYIERLRDEEHEEIASTLIRLVGASEDPAAVPPLRRILSNNTNSKTRWKAARELGELLGRPDPSGAEDDVRVQAARAARAAARQALRELGLKDRNKAVRLFSATSLSQGGLGDARDEPVLDALRVRVERDDDGEVREAAARSILALAPGGGVAYLKRSFAGSDTIWALFRQAVVDEAVAKLSADRALAAAAELAGDGDPRLLGRAFQLLESVATARSGTDPGASLWSSGSDRPRRGVVRERLARLLLQHDRPSEALGWLDDLLGVTRRASDPFATWQWLAARARRALAVSEPTRRTEHLAAARTLLDAARAAPDLPGTERAAIMLELVELELDADRPVQARSILNPGTSERQAERDALATVDAKRLTALRVRVDEAYGAQAQRALALLTAGYSNEGPDTESQRKFKALGPAAARHLREALAGESDVTRVLVMLRAAADLTGKELAQARKTDMTLETLQPAIQKALSALAELAR